MMLGPQPKICRLHCGSWEAGVIPSLGANLAYLKYEGKHVLRSYGAANGNPVLFGTPILLPANRTQNGTFSFQGRHYSLPITDEVLHNHMHGYLMKRSFQIVSQDKNQIKCRYKSTSADYPFPFILTTEISLSEEGCYQKFCIENIGNDDFPIVFGIHTTFSEPDFIKIPISNAWERDSQMIPTGKLRKLHEEEVKWAEGTTYSHQAMTGYFISSNTTARIGRFKYQVSDGFDHWIIYNGNGNAGYLCVEPQAGQVNGLNRTDGHKIVPKAGYLEFDTIISVWE